jgi:lactoylglutathione lyase
MTNPPTPATRGVHHLGLAVADLEATTAFFTDLLGLSLVATREEPRANFVRDEEVMLTLWQIPADEPVPFDRHRNVGLHHLALRIPDLASLDALHARLAEAPGVQVEFAPEPLRDGPTIHMMVYEPSGLRIELIVPG